MTVTLTGAGEPAHYVRSRISSVASLATIEVCETGSFDAPLPPCGPDETEVISVGSALRGLDVWLVDEHDRVIEDDDVCGEIKVAGTSVSPGYWRSDGPLDAIAPSGLRTGDIGFFHKGELYVVERMKNIIIRHGENYSALLLGARARRRTRPTAQRDRRHRQRCPTGRGPRDCDPRCRSEGRS